MDENTTQNNNLQSINNYHVQQNTKNNEEESESFTISSEEAAQILGVNRSRLSQLTQKGVFAFERRKIETRNRLFYRLHDLLSHQRSQLGLQQLMQQSHCSQNKTGQSINLTNNNKDLQEDNNVLFPQKTSSKNNKSFLALMQKRNKILPSAQEMYRNIKRDEADATNQSELQTIKAMLCNHDITLKSLIIEKSKTNNKLEHKIQQNLHAITHCKNILNRLNQDIAIIFKYIEKLSKNSLQEKKVKKFQAKTKPKYIKKQPF